MNFSQETIEAAIDQLFSDNLLPVQADSLKVFKNFLILECVTIEGDKSRADFEARYRKDDRREWSELAA